MADIFHTLHINAPISTVFSGISTSEGLDQWWTLTSDEVSTVGEIYGLGFGPDYQWKAQVTRYEPDQYFELKIIDAQEDWIDTVVGFELKSNNEGTSLNFYHKGWPQQNEHYTISCYCWAMYLRILKRYVEFGEQVPYEKRLEV